MSGGFIVVPEELRSHAGEVDAVAGQLGQAVAAAGTATSLSPQAFGLLCSFFTPPCLAMSTAAIGAIGGMQSATKARAAATLATAADFEDTDHKVAPIFNKQMGQL